VSEKNWVELLKGSGPERDAALNELRGVLVRGLAKSLGRKGGGQAFAEDIAQDALIKILAKLDQFEGRSKFTTWAMSIAIREGISELRRKRFQDVSLEQVTGGEQLKIELAVDDADHPGDEMDRNFLVAKLKDLIENQLTEKQRTVIQAALGGMPIEQIAEKMGSNRNAVYKMVHDAREKLRSGFESQGITATQIQAILA